MTLEREPNTQWDTDYIVCTEDESESENHLEKLERRTHLRFSNAPVNYGTRPELVLLKYKTTNDLLVYPGRA